MNLWLFRCIKELETDTRQVRERWPLAALVKCATGEENRVILSFKSGNSTGNKRIYVMENVTACKVLISLYFTRRINADKID